MNERKLIFCCLLSLLVHEGRAELLEESSDELTEVQADIDVAKQNMQRIELKKAALQSQLAEVEKHYGEIAALLKTLQAQIEQTRQILDKNQQARLVYQKEIDRHSKELAAQIKAAYSMGRREKLRIMLNQQNPALSSRMLMYYTYINKARLKRLDDINAAIKHQGQLDQQKETETKRLNESLNQEQKEQIDLDDAKKQRSELLKQLMRDFSSRQQQLADLKESENKLKGLLSSLQDEKDALATADVAPTTDTAKPESEVAQADSDFPSLQSKLPWPVNGTAHKFGSAREKDLWDGVLINASEGTEVRAVANGKVAYAGPLQGYGSLIIIDHGQGYMTVHGFNQSLYKQKGDSIAAGDVIASVGKSGGRKQSGLYFAIRKQGLPIDPLAWCVKQGK